MQRDPHLDPAKEKCYHRRGTVCERLSKTCAKAEIHLMANIRQKTCSQRLMQARRALMFRIFRLLLRVGVKVGKMSLLTVRGRKSGQPRTTPVWLAEYDGHRFLVSTNGQLGPQSSGGGRSHSPAWSPVREDFGGRSRSKGSSSCSPILCLDNTSSGAALLQCDPGVSAPPL